MTGRPTGADLKPRAVAVLRALRNSPMTTSQLRTAIGDGRKSDPNGLLRTLRAAPLSLVCQRPHDDRWYLTSEGTSWLESNDATPNIALFIVYNAPGASTFHADIVKAIAETGKLPEELDDVLSLKKIAVDGADRWIIDFA